VGSVVVYGNLIDTLGGRLPGWDRIGRSCGVPTVIRVCCRSEQLVVSTKFLGVSLWIYSFFGFSKVSQGYV